MLATPSTGCATYGMYGVGEGTGCTREGGGEVPGGRYLGCQGGQGPDGPCPAPPMVRVVEPPIAVPTGGDQKAAKPTRARAGDISPGNARVMPGIRYFRCGTAQKV